MDRLLAGAQVGVAVSPSTAISDEARAEVPFVPNDPPGSDTPTERSLSDRHRRDGGGHVLVSEGVR